MPGICGNTTIGANNSIPSVVLAHAAVLPAACQYTAVAGDVIDQFHFYGHDNSSGAKTLQLALYTCVAGMPVNLVHVPVTINVPVSGGVYAWHHSAAGLSIPLVAGTTYCLGWTHDGARHRYDSLANATRTANAPLADPWVDLGAPLARYFSIYADIIAAPAPVGVSVRGSLLPALFGQTRFVNQANPAPGAQPPSPTWTVPAGHVWMLQHISFKAMSGEAAVGDRRHVLEIDYGPGVAGASLRMYSGLVLPHLVLPDIGSIKWSYDLNWHIANNDGGARGANDECLGLPYLFLPAGSTITQSLSNIRPLDQIMFIWLQYFDWRV